MNQEHAAALRAKHANLEARIEDELKRPHPDEATVASLKRQKLRIKDELAALDR
ncbi:MAG TPA: YdcH family protein [Alphaproteobacteria bacterium]|jgi:hypothetical protein